MKPCVIGVGGGIGSGKTTFARSLAERLGAEIVAFGDYVRRVASAQNVSPTREALQELGAKLIEELGEEEFVARVLHSVSESSTVIVEGVRHAQVADALRLAAQPRPFAFIFLDAPLDERQARVEASKPAEAARLNTTEEHSTERQVQDGSLAAKAHLVLRSSEHSVDNLVAQAASWLAERFA